MKTDEQIGTEAAETARQEVLRVANKKGVTLGKSILRLNQALDAKETKFFQHEGKVTDTKHVIAHGIRLNAVKLALDLHDAMPSEKHDVTHHAGLSMAEAVEIYRKMKDERQSS